MIPIKEIEYLQTLAKEYKEAADTALNNKKRQQWYDLNDLKTGAKPLFINHYWPLAMKEILPDEDYVCTSKKGKYFETYLRTRLFYAKELEDDNVIEPVIYSQLCFTIDDYDGFSRQIKHSEEDFSQAGAYEMIPVLNEEEDIEQLKLPVVTYDKEASYQNYLEACEIFEPTLKVIKQPFTMAAKIADEFSWLRGLTNTYMDMYDKPEWMHKALRKIADNFVARFTMLQEEGIWGCIDQSNPLGSAGLRYATGIPDFRDIEDPFEHKVALSDSWGFTCAEVFNCVSNDMHDEFSFKYDKEVMDLFKFINVGCCEVLDKKVALCDALENTRKVSVSEWCDHEEAADSIKDRYVYSYRAAGIHFVNDEWKKDNCEKEIRSVLEASKKHGCCTEIVLNIGGTLGKHPRKKVVEWSHLVRDLIDEYYPEA